MTLVVAAADCIMREYPLRVSVVARHWRLQTAVMRSAACSRVATCDLVSVFTVSDYLVRLC